MGICCRKCGWSYGLFVKPSWNFCPECGSSLSSPLKQQPKKIEPIEYLLKRMENIKLNGKPDLPLTEYMLCKILLELITTWNERGI